MGTVSATPQEGGLKTLKLSCLGGKGRSLGTTTVRRIIKESCPENRLPNSLPSEDIMMLRPNLKLVCNLHQSLWATGWQQFLLKAYLCNTDTSHACVFVLCPKLATHEITIMARSPPYPTIPKRLPVLTLVTPPVVWSSCGCRLTGGQSGSVGPPGHWKGISGSGQHENIRSCP